MEGVEGTSHRLAFPGGGALTIKNVRNDEVPCKTERDVPYPWTSLNLRTSQPHARDGWK